MCRRRPSSVWQLNQSPLNDCCNTVVCTRTYYYDYRLFLLPASVQRTVNRTRYKLDQGEKGVKVAAAAGIIYRQLIFFLLFFFSPLSPFRRISGRLRVLLLLHYYFETDFVTVVRAREARAVALFGGQARAKTRFAFHKRLPEPVMIYDSSLHSAS